MKSSTLLKNLPTIYRDDYWLGELYKAGCIVITDIEDMCKKNYHNIFFSTLDEDGCTNYEHDLGLDGKGTLTERRQAIINHWRIGYRCTLPILQDIANGFFDDYVNVEYQGDAVLTYRARLGFKRRYGDKVIESFNTINNMVIPAHFETEWVFEKNKWKYYFEGYYWKDGLNYIWEGLNGFNSWQEPKEYRKHGVTWAYVGTRTWDDHLNLEVDDGLHE